MTWMADANISNIANFLVSVSGRGGCGNAKATALTGLDTPRQLFSRRIGGIEYANRITRAYA